MAFLITTTAEVTLTDLGNRVIPTATSNFNLEDEYKIEEIRYSDSLAEAIYAGEATCIDEFGRTITAQGSLADTKELLMLSFHIEDTDALSEGTSNLYHTDERARASISVASGETNLTYNSTTGELDFSNGPTFSDAVTINGDLTVNGTTTTVNSEDLSIKDNTITLNNGETGPGVSLGQSGIKIDRGTEDPYVFLFDENSDSFRIGSTTELTDGSFDTSELQAVATRQDTPLDEGIAYWNNTESRFDTDANFKWDVDQEFLYIGTEYVSATKIAAWDSMVSGGITNVTAGTGLTSTGTNDITLNVIGGNGITANADDIEVNVDGSTIEVNGSDQLGVVDAGITETQLSTSVAGEGLAGGAGTALSVNVDTTTIGITTDTLGVVDAGITETQLSTSVAGEGLAGGAGTALSVNVDDTTIEIASDILRVKVDGINDTHINWGTGVNQVSAVDMPIEDTAGNFTATDVEAALAEIWDNAGAKYLEDLLDVDMPTGTLGGNDILKYNESTSQWEPGSMSKSWTMNGAINSKNATNRYFDREDGLPQNISAYIAFYNSYIRKIVLNAQSAYTWGVEVRVNGTSVATLASGGSKSAVSADLEVAVVAGDEIALYMNGNKIDYPTVQVLFEEDIF